MIRIAQVRTLYVSIILAGGKGTRMHSADCHKVCFEVDGQPAINRAISTYRACGIEQQVVVVGALAGQVMETVGRAHEGVAFVYQAQQLGTGHAARQGAQFLAAMGFQDAVLVVAGDRLVDAQVIEQMIDLFEQSGSDLVFLSGPRGQAQQGRIVRAADGRVLGIVEHSDLLARQTIGRIRALALAGRPDTAAEARHLMQSAFPNSEKAAKAFGPLWEALAGDERLDLPALLALVPPERGAFEFGNPEVQPTLPTVSPEEVERSTEVNLSVYLLRAPALYWALERLNRDNAQGEEYLSDLVNLLAGRAVTSAGPARKANPPIVLSAGVGSAPAAAVQALYMADRAQVLGFNTPAELVEVETLLRGRRARQPLVSQGAHPGYRTLAEWRELFGAVGAGALGGQARGRQDTCAAVRCAGGPRGWQDAGGAGARGATLAGRDAGAPRGWQGADDLRGELRGRLVQIYGEDEGLLAERVGAYGRLLDECEARFGPARRVLLARAPGRINILGRHIDHQGGNCNLMGIDREVLLAVSLRDDDQINLYNVQREQFADRHFSMRELLAGLTWDDWRSLVDSDQVRQLVLQSKGDWAQYVRAALLRLQKHYPEVPLRGMDMLYCGTIPVAAGLSSSSAMVVATAEAIVSLHGLDVRPRQFVDLCGEGEWFVGTRGGAADHAAMKFAQRDAVINVHFFPFGVGEEAPFPRGYRMVFCNSQIKAQKAAGSREVFNSRITSYHLGREIAKLLYPQYAPLITHLRDISTRNLGLRPQAIYQLLLKLPEHTQAQELAEWLPAATLERILGSGAAHAYAGDYPIRGVVLFGLAEAERSRLFPQALRAGDLKMAGELMRISHDGDRVVAHDESWRAYPCVGPASNRYLLALIDDLESGDPERVLAAQLYRQPGAYACSTPELDMIVDIALRTEGVMGAQLAGAGLGGGAMVLAGEECIPELTQRLIDLYYAPHGLEPAIVPCTPIGGSGILS